MSNSIIVTAIEAGPLEKQVCILAESIRRFGGRLRDAPIVAVIPRLGMPLKTSTRSALKLLDVEVVKAPRHDDLTWFSFLNKTTAVRWAASSFGGDVIWLDADVLTLGEPTDLLISDTGIQFAACCSDKNIGTSSDDDESAPYFQACCRVLGIDYNSLPYIITKMEGVAIRAYWNAGIFSFESASGLAETYDEFTKLLLRQRIGSRACNIIMADQVSLGLAVHKLGLSYRELPLSHNYHVQPDRGDIEKALASYSDIRLLHYHACLWPQTFDRFCGQLATNYPEATEMLKSLGPLDNDFAMASRVGRKLLSIYRRRKQAEVVRQTIMF